MLNSIFESTITTVPFIICSIVSIILGFIISLGYKYTTKSNKNFLITLTILPIIVEAIILMVNGNLGTSIAIMGAFSLVKFRSLPGTSKEILFVFLAMAVGLATGMGQVYLAIILTIVSLSIVFLLTKTTIFNSDKGEKKLKIVIPENLDYNDIFNDVFTKYTDNITLEKAKTINMGSCFELDYKVILKSNINEKEFIDELRTRNGNLKIALSREIDDQAL